MELDEYQRRTLATDQNPTPHGAVTVDSREPQRHEVVSLLGLVGEVGGLLSEYKKLLRDGATHRRFQDEVAEELGDILWYVANVATKFGLTLGKIAEQNLVKVEDRWRVPEHGRLLYDEHLPARQQLPRRFEYSFEQRIVDGVRKLVLVDCLEGGTAGDPLTDNAYEDDGYRFHDVMHLALAAYLGWSPVLRKLLRARGVLDHRTPSDVEEVEDGGRAQVLDEAIVAATYVYAADHDYLNGVNAVDWHLLRHIKQLTSHVEVKNRSAKEWNDTLLAGVAVWRQLRQHGGGIVRGDLLAGSLVFISPK